MEKKWAYGDRWKDPSDSRTYEIKPPVDGDTAHNCTHCPLKGHSGCVPSPCTDVRPWGYMSLVPDSMPRKAPKLQETSLKAHASQKDKAPSDCATILARIRKYRMGTTCDKLEQVLSMSHQTTSARINDLVRKGRIRDSGRREKTRTGRLAICWKAVEA